MTRLICGWCKKEFEARIFKSKMDGGRNLLFCSNCGHLLPSSKKESTGEVVGRKHVHVEWKDGDIV